MEDKSNARVQPNINEVKKISKNKIIMDLKIEEKDLKKEVPKTKDRSKNSDLSQKYRALANWK